jgi:hypothetical protein
MLATPVHHCSKCCLVSMLPRGPLLHPRLKILLSECWLACADHSNNKSGGKQEGVGGAVGQQRRLERQRNSRRGRDSLTRVSICAPGG